MDKEEDCECWAFPSCHDPLFEDSEDALHDSSASDGTKNVMHGPSIAVPQMTECSTPPSIYEPFDYTTHHLHDRSPGCCGCKY